jgi:hypothetical protein
MNRKLAEAALTWRVVQVDSQRWKIVDPDGAPAHVMPRAVHHPQLGYDVAFFAPMAPRKIAQEALDACRRGEAPPAYRFAGSGALERAEAPVVTPTLFDEEEVA